MSDKASKTQTSFYRRLYVAYLIDSGINTVPAIMAATGMPRRTAQDTLSAIPELTIQLKSIGGEYVVQDWGVIHKAKLGKHLQHVRDVLKYP